MNPETTFQKSEKHDNYLREMEGHLLGLTDKVIAIQKQETFTQADADEIENLLFELRYSWTEFKMTPTIIIKKGDKE